MIRALLTIVLPLLLPTGLYLLWAITMRRTAAAGIGDVLRGLPWPWLAGGGVVLLVGVLALVTLGFGSGDRGIYVPPHAVDGKIIPGHIEPVAPARP
jgi:Family of unknown function (DUF6111)